MNKAHAVKLSTDLIGDEFAQERNQERKLDLAASMERAFAENAAEAEGLDITIASKTSRWLPEGMTFEDTQRIEDDLDVSVDRDDLQTAETLPAFMQGGAA